MMIPEPRTPEYFLDSFPRDRFPQYCWTDRPASLPASVWTTETTHRDGQQGGLPLTTAQGLAIYDLLCRFTGSGGAIRQAEFFVYHPSDRATLEGALARYQSGAPIEPTTWIRASARDVALIRALGGRETGMRASASDDHTLHKFTPGGRNQAARTYLEAVRCTVDAGIRPRLHLEDATRAPIDFMQPFIEAVQDICASARLTPKCRVCDTMGLGLPYTDVALPRSIPCLFETLRAMGMASKDLELHPHHDTWLVVANCLAAVRAGCAVINGTCLGKGERTGNAPLEGSAGPGHVVRLGNRAVCQRAPGEHCMGRTRPAALYDQRPELTCHAAQGAPVRPHDGGSWRMLFWAARNGRTQPLAPESAPEVVSGAARSASNRQKPAHLVHLRGQDGRAGGCRRSTRSQDGS